MVTVTSETVHFELVRLGEAILGEPLTDVLALVALQLQDLAVLGVLDDGAVARELLLARLHDLLEVVLGGQALDGGERFAAVPLLNPDVHEPVLHVILAALEPVRERVELGQVLDGGHADRHGFALKPTNTPRRLSPARRAVRPDQQLHTELNAANLLYGLRLFFSKYERMSAIDKYVIHTFLLFY